MHVHILGICGTAMAGIALIARAAGYRVSGSDANVYPPMSTQLADQGITVLADDDLGQLDPAPDVVVIGNALSRGHPLVEAVLDRGIRYTSGAQWLSDHVLQSRWVLAVAGTHGKTTTASMLAWILEHAGLSPGFLIGGLPGNFGVSARLGDSDFFVIEADEYDTAFFDKRSKFVHYRPRTLVLNNLEFDHADIFDDLAAIERQFHHLIRTVPPSGRILCNAADPNLPRVLDAGCWSEVEAVGGHASGWRMSPTSDDASRFDVAAPDGARVSVTTCLPGAHNMANAVAAMAAARHVGVTPATSADALASFDGVARRLQVRGAVGGVTVYDDFAHHPTAIRATIAALRARVGRERIVAILEPRSNTMKRGVHQQTLADSLREADAVHILRPAGLSWDMDTAMAGLDGLAQVHGSVADIIDAVAAATQPADGSPAHLLVMSNGGFDGIHQRLLDALAR